MHYPEINVSQMKRILFIASTNLHIKDGGALGQRACYQSICDIYPGMVDLVLPKEGQFGIYEKALGVPARSKIAALLSFSIHRYKKFLARYLRNNQGKYGLCIISGGMYAGDMMDMLHNFGLKVVVMHLNFEPEFQMDNKTLWSFKGLSDCLVRKIEGNAYRKSDANCFISICDKNLFENAYGKRDVPFTINGAFEYDSKPLPDMLKCTPPKVIAITGSMNTRQTIIGVMDFKNRYFSIVRNYFPDWKITIAGRNPDKLILNFACENQIKLIANPENMEDVVSQAMIFLCPTNVGGGVKLRVMDGLRMGRPVLVHKVSARGYEHFAHEPFFRIYDNEESFLSGLSDLIAYCQSYNPSIIQEKYLEEFSFNAGRDRFRMLFEQLSF